MLVVAALVAVAVAVRLPLLPFAFIGADSVDPLWRAYKILTLKELLPPLHSPVGGYALYYNLLPAFIGAHGLGELLRNQWLVASLLPAPAYLGCRLGLRSLLGRGSDVAAGRAVGILAGLWLALSPELADTPLSGARTYLAPLWMSVVTGAVVATLGGRRGGLPWLGISIPLAAMNHPFALAALPGTASLGRRLWRVGRPWAAWALGLAALLSAPHLYYLIPALAQGGLARATEGSSLAEGFWPQLARSYHDAFLVQPPAAVAAHGLMFAGPLLCLGVGLWAGRRAAPRGDEDRSAAASTLAAFGLWAAAAPLTLTALAVTIAYLQHYHLRLVMPPLAVAGAWGVVASLEGCILAARGPRGAPRWAGSADFAFALAAGASVAGATYHQARAFDFLRDDPAHRLETAGAHLDISAAIAADAGGRPRVVDALHIASGQTLNPPAIVLDQLLAGAPEAAFPTTPEGTEAALIYLTLVAPDPLLDEAAALVTSRGGGVVHRLGGQAMQGEALGGALTLRLEGASAARRFTSSLCALLPEGTLPRTGTVYNYMAPLNPDFDAAWVGGWLDPCVLGQPP